MLKFDDLYHMNQYVDTELTDLMGDSRRSNYMIEERHTDQLDYNLAVNEQHNMRNNMKIVGGANLRVNRTNYYSQVKDLLGGDYWYDIDKFAERDMASETTAYQNDLDYYWSTGHARIAARVTCTATITGPTCSNRKPGPTTRGPLADSRWVCRIGRLFADVPRGYVAQGPLPRQLEGRFEEARLPDL